MPETPTRSIRPLCRAYAVGLVLTQLAYLLYLQQKGSMSSLVYVVVALVLVGGALVAMNRPIGRMVFFAPAVLQFALGGLLTQIAFVFVLISLLMPDPEPVHSVALLAVGAFSMFYLFTGLILFTCCYWEAPSS